MTETMDTLAGMTVDEYRRMVMRAKDLAKIAIDEPVYEKNAIRVELRDALQRFMAVYDDVRAVHLAYRAMPKKDRKNRFSPLGVISEVDPDDQMQEASRLASIYLAGV